MKTNELLEEVLEYLENLYNDTYETEIEYYCGRKYKQWVISDDDLVPQAKTLSDKIREVIDED